MENRITGTIIHLSKQGWGFVTTPDIPFTRIFFHWTALNQDTLNFTELKRGMRVEFETKEFLPRGLRAIKISVIKENLNDDDSRGTDNGITETLEG
jgi:cold shock CspA family protein